jgi:DNA invertase Pin-like site-specific DNA recombinase
MQVIGYRRASTEEQARDGPSLDAQAEKIRAYTLAQGWTLAEIIWNAGHSAKSL